MKEKQKFPRGCRVHVGDNFPTYMSHFDKNFDGIIEYSYRQFYGHGKYTEYSILKLEKNKVVDSIAWYPESTLILISDDIEAGKKIIENYNFPN